MERRIFAFKLASKINVKKRTNPERWKARDDLALAGCTEYPGGGGENDLRDRKYGTDMGNFC